MSNGHPSVNISSLYSMYPEAGFMEAYESHGHQPATKFASAPDTFTPNASSADATMLGALDTQKSHSNAAQQSSSGLFDMSEEMLFQMMGEAGGDEYGADPMASFGNYNSFSPHWKSDPAGSTSESAMQDNLMNKIAASDSAQVHRRKLQ